jgi:hypothetical protein
MSLRSELPRPIPYAIEHLPRHRDYPVPWFVGWLDDEGDPMPRTIGTPDFRVIFPNAINEAMTQALCWICGRPHNSKAIAYAFVIGPMCAVNRVSAEPPSHVACADWAARACPFLVRPHMERREGGMPEHGVVAGEMIKRNPGIALVWLTKTGSARPAPNGGVLFNVGDPLQVRFYREGRLATREEVLESIKSGLPILEEMADEEGPEAREELNRQTEAAMQLLPA